MHDDNAKERVREAVDLVRLIEAGGVELKRQGEHEWAGKCPFHNEKTGSFTVNTQKGFWHCFGCNEHGDCFDWLMKRKGIDFPEALRQLALEVNVRLPDWKASEARLYRPEVGPAPSTRLESERFRALTPGSKVFTYLTGRGLTPEMMREYRVCETADGEAYGFQYCEWAPAKLEGMEPRVRVVFVKCVKVDRPEGKKEEWRHPKGRNSILYGMTTVGSQERELVISEGEIDAITWRQYGFAAVSVPSGAGSLGWIEVAWPWLEQFERIHLSFDEDRAGREKLLEVVRRLGEARADMVRLPMREGGQSRYKDANECLQAGVSVETMRECVATAEVVKPEKLKSIYDFEEQIWEKFHPTTKELQGLALPWGNQNNSSLPFRFRPGEVTVWSGFNGHGKSQVLNHVIVDLANQGQRGLIASLEMQAPETYRRILRVAHGRQEIVALNERDQLRGRLAWVADRIWVYDHVGMSGLTEVLEVCEYAFRRYGIRQFVFDSLMRFVLSGDEDQYEEQKRFMDELINFSMRFKVHCHLVAHAKKLKSENQIPRKYDIAGSAAISNLAWNVIIVWRNKAKEEKKRELWEQLRVSGITEWTNVPQGMKEEFGDLEEERDAYFIVDKQRGGEGDEPARNLWFDRASLQFVEKPGEPARRYVPEKAEEYEEVLV